MDSTTIEQFPKTKLILCQYMKHFKSSFTNKALTFTYLWVAVNICCDNVSMPCSISLTYYIYCYSTTNILLYVLQIHKIKICCLSSHVLSLH